MRRWFRKHPWAVLGAGSGLGLLVGVGMLIGALATMAVRSSAPAAFFPDLPLHATCTDAGSNFSMATGQVADGVEGVFFLDFLTGEVQCWVLDRRTGVPCGYYVYNVLQDLGVDPANKNPRYLMVTGLAPGTGGSARSDSLLYVADATSGNFAIYALPWHRGASAARTLQKWPMVCIYKNSARNLALRGQ